MSLELLSSNPSPHCPPHLPHSSRTSYPRHTCRPHYIGHLAILFASSPCLSSHCHTNLIVSSFHLTSSFCLFFLFMPSPIFTHLIFLPYSSFLFLFYLPPHHPTYLIPLISLTHLHPPHSLHHLVSLNPSSPSPHHLVSPNSPSPLSHSPHRLVSLNSHSPSPHSPYPLVSLNSSPHSPYSLRLP